MNMNAGVGGPNPNQHMMGPGGPQMPNQSFPQAMKMGQAPVGQPGPQGKVSINNLYSFRYLDS